MKTLAAFAILVLVSAAVVGAGRPFEVGPKDKAQEAAEATARKRKADFRARLDQAETVRVMRKMIMGHPSFDGVDLGTVGFPEKWDWQDDCGACSLRAGSWYIDWTRFAEDGFIRLTLGYQSQNKQIASPGDGDRMLIVRLAVKESDGHLAPSFLDISTTEVEAVLD